MKSNRFQKFFIYFMIISLIGISVATNSISDESKDGNQIKYLSYSSLPYYMEPNNSTNKLDSNNLIPSKEFGNQTHPAIASNTNSYLLAFNDADYGNIFWGTFNDSVSFDINGGTYPSIKHQNNSTYYGTFVANPQQDSGAYIPVFKTTNPENFNTYEMSLLNWEEYGWYNFTDVEIACDPSGDDPYFGFISLVGSTTYGEGFTNAPHIFYYLGPDYATLSWLVQYDNCSHTDACIDHQTKHAYAIYDHFNGNNWDLVLRKDNFGNNMSSIDDYIINGTGNLTYPKISVQNDQMVIVCETDQEDNKDIIGIYNTPNDPQQVLIANSDADERFPEIERIDDTTYICSFISNNTLFYSISANGGQTWSNPIKIKENVIEAYKSVDLSENLDYMGCEVINGSYSDVEFDDLRQSIVFVDDDYDNSTPGWQYDHFDIIQDGIDAVDENGTVYVYNGMYYENAVVDKTIDLVGEDKNSTIIDGGGTGDVIYVDADYVMISGFTVTNSGTEFNDAGIELNSNNNTIMGNNASNNDYGILWWHSSNNMVMYNEVNSNSFSGIHIVFSSNNTIKRNTADSNYYNGIYLSESWNNMVIGNNASNSHRGIGLSGCNNINITGNNVLNNENGIEIEYSSNNIVMGNNAYSNNYTGIRLIFSSINTITGNNAYSNNYNGINLWDSSNNTIYNNIFINSVNSGGGGDNTWNITKTPGTNIIGGPYLGGNFWSDYRGQDLDDDGIGDTNVPYGPGDHLPIGPFMDLNQSIQDRGFPIRHAMDGDWAGAQNFTPTYNTLFYTEIYLRKFGTPEFDLTVELRTDGPEGTLLDSLVFTPAEVPSSWTWLELDFTDVTIQTGTDYFIVCPPAPSGVEFSFGYEWGYAFGNQYDGGSFWFTRDGGELWRDLPTMYEFAFRTFGYS